MINCWLEDVADEHEFISLIHNDLGITLKPNPDQSRSDVHALMVVGHSPIAQYVNRYAIQIKHYQELKDSGVNRCWWETVKRAERIGFIPLLAFQTSRQWRVIVPLRAVTRPIGEPSFESTPRTSDSSMTAWLDLESFCLHVRESVNQSPNHDFRPTGRILTNTLEV
ncbi:MAG: hypothetical protein GKR95_02090 [Gammaproteobacteria bacterium]|nr:hypothetical protein [Gammaproteobacteria bacterium]